MKEKEIIKEEGSDNKEIATTTSPTSSLDSTSTPITASTPTITASSSPSPRPKPTLVIPEKELKKQDSLKEASPEIKKSPKVIKESNLFGDVLGDMMKEPIKRKRRFSDVKAEREARKEFERAEAAAEKKRKEDEELEKAKSKEDANKEEDRTSSGTEEDQMETGDNSDGNESGCSSTKANPREVRGILVFVKGRQKKRRVQWKSDADLVDIQYFEMDDTERANVWKLKSFEEMRKAELARERLAGTKGMEDEEEEGTEPVKEWKWEILEFLDNEIKEQVERIWECYGRDFKEKGVQEEREGRVLRSLFFNKLPSDPSEP